MSKENLINFKDFNNQLQIVYSKYQSNLEIIYRKCFNSTLKGSNSALEKIIFGNHKHIKKYQSQCLAYAVNYDYFENYISEDAFENIGYLDLLNTCDDIIQQFLCAKSHLLSKENLRNSDGRFFNHHFNSYKNGYQAYGNLEYSYSTNNFTFWLREFDPLRIEPEGYGYVADNKFNDFQNKESTRRIKIKDLTKVLNKSGIKYLNLSEWFGLYERGMSPFLLDTSDKFDYPKLNFTRWWLGRKI